MKNQHKTLSIIAVLIVLGLGYFIFGIENEGVEHTVEEETHMEHMDLQIEVLREGDGVEAQNGNIVAVHYTGTLEDGTVFDSSIPRGNPFVFLLGAGQVIQGWDLGVLGMKVGEVRKLTIPSELGYGTAGAGSVIPSNATLIFEVELLGVEERS